MYLKVVFDCYYSVLDKNSAKVSSSHKNSVFTSLRDFKKFFPNTFIYELIWIKNYIYAKIMNMQIYHQIKYDLKDH